VLVTRCSCIALDLRATDGTRTRAHVRIHTHSGGAMVIPVTSTSSSSRRRFAGRAARRSICSPAHPHQDSEPAAAADHGMVRHCTRTAACALARSSLTLPCCALRHYCCLSLRAPSNFSLALLLLFCRAVLQFIQSSQSLQKKLKKKKDLEKLLESIATNVFMMMMKRTEGGKERREDSTSPPGSNDEKKRKMGGNKKRVTQRQKTRKSAMHVHARGQP